MMRGALLTALCLLSLRADPLTIHAAVVQQYEDGPSVYKPDAFTPGETVHFSFFLDHFARKQDQVNVRFIARALDPARVPLAPPVESATEATLTPEDKEWRPKFRGAFTLPPVLLPGEYCIAIHASDDLSKATVDRSIPFLVSGAAVEQSSVLTISNAHFYAGEESIKPLTTPAYRITEAIFARFDVVGFKHTSDGTIDVSYGITLADSFGNVLFQEKEVARDQTTSFYPKPYVAGIAQFNLKPGTRPGEYTLTVAATDAVGDQHAEAHRTFRLE